MAKSADLTRREEGYAVASIGARLLAAGLIIAILTSGFLMVKQGNDVNFTILLVLSAFAAIGFFYLICGCFGIARLTMREIRHAHFINMFNQMEQAIVITDQEGTIRYMNERYHLLTHGKKRPPEVLFSIDEKATRTLSLLRKNIAKGQDGYGEIYLSRPLVHPVEHEKNQESIYGVRLSLAECAGETLSIWLIEDITNRRATQMHQFGALSQAINHLDHAPAGFMAWDGAGNITYLNATLAHWIGFDLAAHLPDRLTLSRLIGAQCSADLQKFLHKKRRTSHSSSGLTLDLFHEDGRRFQVLFYPCLTEEEDDLVGRAVLIPAPSSSSLPSGHDEIKTALDADSAPIAHYFQACPIALAVLDEQGRIELHNQHFATLFGLGGQPHRQLADLMPQDEAQRVTQWLERFLKVKNRFSDKNCGETQEQGLIQELDTHLTRHDGKLEEVRHVRLFLRKLEEATPLCVIAAVEIDEQRALEAHMEQGQKMQAVGQLAGGIAHDFNNVLTAIIMSCDLLLSTHRHSDPSHSDIMNIKHNAYRGATLVRQLLAFSRRQTLQPEVLDVSAMLADVQLMITHLVGVGITVKIEHGRDLWPIRADYSALERVIINLASNARDAMPQGGQLTLRSSNVGAQELDPRLAPHLGNHDYVLIEIRDNGIGMEEGVREKIFEPFFTTKEVGRGTGLGLAIVYGIVTQSGGYIHCDSALGQGTCFSIYLPRHIATEQENEAKLAEPQKNSAVALRDLSGSATVLVVEDEDAVRRGSVKALQSRGYTVLEAADGLQALEIEQLHKGQVDLIISDVVMPEMLLRKVRELYPQIKFIFVSGYAEDAFAKNLPEDAHFAFLPKPFSLKQLALTVKEMLEGS